MPINTWPTTPAPQLRWEVFWFTEYGEPVLGECFVLGAPPDLLARAITGALEREGVPVDKPDDVVGRVTDIDDLLATFLRPYVDCPIDLQTFRYQISAIDESGGRPRKGWGEFADEAGR